MEPLLLEAVCVLLPQDVLLAATVEVAATAAAAAAAIAVAGPAAVAAEAVAIFAALRPLHVAQSETCGLSCNPRSLLAQFPSIELREYEADLVFFQR